MNTGNTRYLDKLENRTFYDTSDGQYMGENMITHPSMYLQRLRWAKDWIHSNNIHTVLDVGTKDGYFPIELTLEGVDVTAIDPSVDAIELAKQRAKTLHLNINYIVSYLEDYDLDTDEFIQNDGKYEAVVCCEVIEHVVDDKEFIYKLASAGHYVLISTPWDMGRHGWQDAERNEAHVRLYSPEELAKLCSRYGKVLENTIIDDQICICFRSDI